MTNLSTQAASARETARRANGRFGEQSHTDPGPDILGAGGADRAVAVFARIDHIAPADQVDNQASMPAGAGRLARLTGQGAATRIVLSDHRGHRLADAPIDRVWDSEQGRALTLADDIPAPPNTDDPYAPDPCSYDRDDMQGRLGADMDQWEQEYGDQYRATTLDADQADRLRSFVARYAPATDGLTHRLDARRLGTLTSFEAGQVADDLEARFDDRHTVGEAIGIHGVSVDDWYPGTLTFGTVGRTVAVSDATWRVAGGTPTEAPDVAWPYRADDIAPPF